MLKSKRKLIITLTVVGVIVLLLIVSSALFSLKTVTIDYLSLNTDVEHSVMATYNKDEIIKAGNFAYNKNILFIKYDGAKDRIEKAFPFAKVLGFVRHFPSSVVVSLTEREPVAKILRNDGKWVVLDDELKVLIVSYTLDSYYANLPTLDNTIISTAGAQEGTFLSSPYLASAIHNIKRGITDDDVNLNMKTISTISISTGDALEDYIVNMLLNDGCRIVFKGINNLAEKSLAVFKTYNTVKNDTTNYPEINKVTISVESDYRYGNPVSVTKEP